MLARLRIPLVPKPFDLETICEVVAEAAARVLRGATLQRKRRFFGEETGRDGGSARDVSGRC